MTDDAQMSSGDEDTQPQVTASEKAALERKKRLLAMKSRVHGVPMKEEDYMETDQPTKRSLAEGPQFRNYAPGSDIGKKDDVKFDYNVIEKEIAQHLQDTTKTDLPEQIDPSTLQPKKADWDLKRNIEKKLQKLDRHTQRAIAEIIRERLQETGDLAAAVHASSRADEA